MFYSKGRFSMLRVDPVLNLPSRTPHDLFAIPAARVQAHGPRPSEMLTTTVPRTLTADGPTALEGRVTGDGRHIFRSRG